MGIQSLVRKTGFLAETHSELMTKSSTCMTNNLIIGSSLRDVMGASLTDVTGVLSSPRGVTTAELTYILAYWCVSLLGSSSILKVSFDHLES